MRASLRTTRSFLTFFSLFMMGNVVLFGFQNCGKAKMGFSGDPAVNQGLGNEVPVDAVCPAGEAAIGYNAGSLICVQIQDRGGNPCPTGEYLYGYDAAGGARCIRVSDRDPAQPVCDYNRELESYTSTGALTCVRMPGSRPNYDCPPGEYLRGVVNGVAICSGPIVPPPPVPPGSMSCPVGQQLRGTDGNGAPVCETIVLPFPTPKSCPAGQAIVGMTAGNIVCQTLMPPPHPDAACNGGQMVVSQSASAVTCGNLPERDLVYYCPTGQYLSTVSDQGYACVDIPSPDHKWNGTCGQGFYLMGYVGNQPICSPQTPPDWNYSCPKGTYLNGIYAGAYVCLPFDDNNPCGRGFELVGGICKDRTPPVITVTKQPVNGSSRTAEIEYTVTDRDSDLAATQCEFDGAAFANCDSPVNLSNLTPGFHQFVIVARDVEGNEATKQIQWLVSSCSPGESVSCPIANGTGAMVCKADGTGYDLCVPQTCNAGYEKQGNACVPKTCDPGFVFEAGQCVDKEKPVITVTKRPVDGNDRNAEVIYTVTDVGSGVKSVSCKLDNRVYSPCVSPITIANLPLGYHEIAIFAVDNAGNQASKYIKWTIGTVCTPNASVPCDVANGSGVKVCAADGSGYGSCVPNRCDDGYELKNGQCVKLNCPAGYEVSGNACVDRTKPVVQITSGPAALTSSTSAKLVFTGSDVGSGIAKFECSINGSAYQECSSPKNYSGLAKGNYLFYVRVTDKAGNYAEASHAWKVVTCQPGEVKSCSIPNGTGQMVCAADGSAYGACQPKSCEAGYHLENGQCAKDGDGGNDPVCRKGAHKSFFVEMWARLPSTLPASCQSGAEIWNVSMSKSIVIKSANASGTSADRQIDLDYATYRAANSARITAKLADGSSKVIFEPCLISTHRDVETRCLTAGAGSRPIDSAIRDFRVVVPRSTVELKIQGLDNNTPWYVMIKGLCEFKVSQPVYSSSLQGSEKYRPFGDEQLKLCQVVATTGESVSSMEPSVDACKKFWKDTEAKYPDKVVQLVEYDRQVIYRLETKKCEVKFSDWSYVSSQQKDERACLDYYWKIRKQNWWKKVVYVKFDGRSIRNDCHRD